MEAIAVVSGPEERPPPKSKGPVTLTLSFDRLGLAVILNGVRWKFLGDAGGDTERLHRRKLLLAVADNIALHPIVPSVSLHTPPQKNPDAVALGKLGCRKGGLARAQSLSAERRREIARKAAQTRWSRERSRISIPIPTLASS